MNLSEASHFLSDYIINSQVSLYYGFSYRTLFLTRCAHTGRSSWNPVVSIHLTIPYVGIFFFLIWHMPLLSSPRRFSIEDPFIVSM
ncbi:uncharacterized protein F4807DRAFT_366637 [Annulohypoxylon truncatum]|uniref:uncharacterized protein n=1 Tax=Annulohypoxylon truncatum TaxID=327061 RepID=UPI0020081659|nr:uncharacterized protein F4807DRAFT_366637 [Annulohypoxylon truncatum]KAI1212320.1 hypothetical protein F4807DRAFT_366637 [Annulohypoxylon truncatum]